MRAWVYFGIAALLAMPAAGMAQDGWGQIAVDNKSSATVDLYVDGNYGCRALAGGMCPTQVRVGVHNLEARASGRDSIFENGVDVAQGQVRTWTILDR